MKLEEDVTELPAGDWLELANGGGVMLRKALLRPPTAAARYVRRRKLLLGESDPVE